MLHRGMIIDTYIFMYGDNAREMVCFLDPFASERCHGTSSD